MRVPQPAVPVVRDARPAAVAAAPVPTANTSADMKIDSPGNRTPTADEPNDEPSQPQPAQAAQPQAAVARFQSQFGAVPVAQRFPGALPVQVRWLNVFVVEFLLWSSNLI